MQFAYYSYHMTDAAMLTSARCSKCGYMPQQDASGQICHKMSFFFFYYPCSKPVFWLDIYLLLARIAYVKTLVFLSFFISFFANAVFFALLC